MFITKPSRIMEISNSDDGVLADGMHFTFRMQRDSIAKQLKYRDKYPSETDLKDCAQHLTEITDLEWSISQVHDLLALYPQARIGVAVNGVSESESSLSFAVAHFFLNASWPTFGDKVDMTKFIALLQQQASLMGFEKAQSN